MTFALADRLSPIVDFAGISDRAGNWSISGSGAAIDPINAAITALELRLDGVEDAAPCFGAVALVTYSDVIVIGIVQVVAIGHRYCVATSGTAQAHPSDMVDFYVVPGKRGYDAVVLGAPRNGTTDPSAAIQVAMNAAANVPGMRRV